MDVLSASLYDNTIAWYENDGNAGFTKRVITSDAIGARSVFAIDVDGDGDIDVLSASSNDNTIAWYENDGVIGNLGFTKWVVTSDAITASSVFAIDVDGDGDIDVLSASLNDNTIAWYENDGAVGFTKRVITSDAIAATSVFAIDVDGDDNMDVLSASYADDTIAWYKNDGALGNPGFTKQVITSNAYSVRSVFAIDVDGDGNMDVLSGVYGSNTIAWYENDGSVGNPGFTEHVITTDAAFVNSVFALDVDGDGDIDVLSASETDNTIAWYENDGAVGFTKRVITSVAVGASSVFAIDVDGDGDVDVLSASRENDTIAWYESRAAYDFVVPEFDTFVGNVQATDADGDNITFGISTGADQDLFIIDETGALSFNIAPSLGDSANGDNTYHITVTATANGDVVSSTVVINVTIGGDEGGGDEGGGDEGGGDEGSPPGFG
jgi:hypothetical protein